MKKFKSFLALTMAIACMSSAIIGSNFESIMTVNAAETRMTVENVVCFDPYDVIQFINEDYTFFALPCLSRSRLIEIDEEPTTEEEMLALIRENNNVCYIVKAETPYVIAIIEYNDYTNGVYNLYVERLDCDLNKIACTVDTVKKEIRDYYTGEVYQDLSEKPYIYIGPMETISYNGISREGKYIRSDLEYCPTGWLNVQPCFASEKYLFDPSFSEEDVKEETNERLEALGIKLPENYNPETDTLEPVEGVLPDYPEKKNDSVSVKISDNSKTMDTPASIVLGDLNNSKNVDMTDLLDLSLYLLNEKTLTAEQLKAADVDENGTVNVADLALLKQYVSGVGVKLGK